MKSPKSLLFIHEATVKLIDYESAIETSDTYEKAKSIAHKALGFIDCLVIYNNLLICSENNGFTEEFDELLEELTARVYRSMADAAIRHDEPYEVIHKLITKLREFEPRC